MAQIYYKNSHNLFNKLTYKDFGAAEANHMHSHEDIVYKTQNTEEDIPQIFGWDKGGTGKNSLNPIKAAKMLAVSELQSEFIQIPANNGVFGYFDGYTNSPSFKTWPISAGGTGHNNQIDAISEFNIGINNTSVDFNNYGTINDKNQWIFNLNNQHILNAYITSSLSQICFSIYLPFQLLPGTAGILELYPLIISQPSTDKQAYITPVYEDTTQPILEGFSARFITDQETLTNNNIFRYGFSDTGTTAGFGGQYDINSQGSVTIWSYSGGEVTNNEGELQYYQAGHIITVEMTFDQGKEPWATDGTNNRPVLLTLNKGLNDLNNRIIIEKQTN